MLFSARDRASFLAWAADNDLLETLGGTMASGRFLNDATSRYPTVVLGAIAAERLGISDRGSAYAEFQAKEVTVVSRSGLKQVAYDGEMGDTATEFSFTKGGSLTVYCCRTT